MDAPHVVSFRGCLQIDCFRQPGARPGALTPEFPGRTTRACFSGSGDLLALLRDGLGVRIVDYRALQSRCVPATSCLGPADARFGASQCGCLPKQRLEMRLLLHASSL